MAITTVRLEGWNLESVGTFLRADGMTFAMGADGSADNDNGIHLRDIEPDGDWMASLSDADLKIVEAVTQR